MRNTIFVEAIAAAAGTLVMTAALRRAFPRLLPRGMRRREFLPQEVIDGIERKAACRGTLPGRLERATNWPARFAYGTTAGAGERRLRPPRPPQSAATVMRSFLQRCS